MRSWDATIIAPAIAHFLKTEDKVDPIDWLSDPDNIVLVNEIGDIALFEKGIKHIYTGHYYFKSRGRQAITSGKAFLDELLNSCYNISIVTGLCPLEHLGARWLTRQLGFTSHGVVDYIDNKHYELFILTKEEFNQ